MRAPSCPTLLHSHRPRRMSSSNRNQQYNCERNPAASWVVTNHGSLIHISSSCNGNQNMDLHAGSLTQRGLLKQRSTAFSLKPHSQKRPNPYTKTRDPTKYSEKRPKPYTKTLNPTKLTARMPSISGHGSASTFSKGCLTGSFGPFKV